MRAPLDEIEQTQRWNTAGQPPGLLTHPTHPIILPTPDMKRPSFTYTCAPAHYQSDYATTTAAASTAVSCKPHEPGTAAHLGVSSPPRLASYHVQAATGRPSQPEQQQTPPPPPPPRLTSIRLPPSTSNTRRSKLQYEDTPTSRLPSQSSSNLAPTSKVQFCRGPGASRQEDATANHGLLGRIAYEDCSPAVAYTHTHTHTHEGRRQGPGESHL